MSVTFKALTAPLRRYYTRHVLKRVRVRGGRPPRPRLRVRSSRRLVPAPLLKTQMRTLTTQSLSFQRNVNENENKKNERIFCPVRGFRFLSPSVKTRKAQFRRFTVREMKNLNVNRVPLIKGVASRDGLARAVALPQERTNRLKWQKQKAREPGEMILAWYGPLVEKAVIKLALDKQQGRLLIWYNSQSKHFKTGSVYLFRRLGNDTKPEWRWV